MEPETEELLTETDLNLGTDSVTEEPKKSRKLFWILFALFDFLIITPILVTGIVWFISNQAPSDFVPQTVTIEQGTSVQMIAEQLASQNIVKSELLLHLTLRFGVDATAIQAGTYQFTNPLTTTEVAEKLVSGEIYHELISVTFIEGMRAQEYAASASAALTKVSREEFLVKSKGLEGSLFPETYFVPEDFSTEQLIDLLTNTHHTTLTELLANSDPVLTNEGVVILASIVEREANTPESMATVAGVFLNRMEIGMPLQADASIEYVIDTPLGKLAPGQLATELRELDSPYNTYLNPGLPPTPIGNPGRTALAAVISPIESDYFYYITGNDGEFYYAETYNQHLTNIERHLR